MKKEKKKKKKNRRRRKEKFNKMKKNMEFKKGERFEKVFDGSILMFSFHMCAIQAQGFSKDK